VEQVVIFALCCGHACICMLPTKIEESLGCLVVFNVNIIFKVKLYITSFMFGQILI
jgi:hypothetical protein